MLIAITAVMTYEADAQPRCIYASSGAHRLMGGPSFGVRVRARHRRPLRQPGMRRAPSRARLTGHGTSRFATHPAHPAPIRGRCRGALGNGTLSLGSLRQSTRLMGVVTARSAGRIRALAGPLSASAPHEQGGRCRRDIEIRVPSARAAEPHRLELQTNDQSRGVDVAPSPRERATPRRRARRRRRAPRRSASPSPARRSS